MLLRESFCHSVYNCNQILNCINFVIMNKIIKDARQVVSKEKRSILDLEKRFLNDGFQKKFIKAVETIFNCKGKVVITGIGKSGIIAQKIVATFNSTGTYSTFLHSADSIHGDLGIVRENDVVILISKSGGTTEVTRLIPVFKELGVKTILITGASGFIGNFLIEEGLKRNYEVIPSEAEESVKMLSS